MAVVMLAVSVNTALAETLRKDFQFAGGKAFIDIAGHPRIRLVASGMWSSDFGLADFIQISVDSNPSGDPIWVQASSYEDDHERSAFSESLGLPGVTHYVVKPWQIQVFRIGKTSFVLWTVPLVAPETATTPEVVIPPGLLVLRGFGEPISEEMPPAGNPLGLIAIPFGPNGWYLRMETHCSYEAHATLFCRGWRYCGPVGEGYACRSIKDLTWFWWDYNPNPPPPP